MVTEKGDGDDDGYMKQIATRTALLKELQLRNSAGFIGMFLRENRGRADVVTGHCSHLLISLSLCTRKTGTLWLVGATTTARIRHGIKNTYQRLSSAPATSIESMVVENDGTHFLQHIVLMLLFLFSLLRGKLLELALASPSLQKTSCSFLDSRPV